MNNYQSKALRMYLNFFLKDRITDFKNRSIKAKEEAMHYVLNQIEVYKNNPEDLFYWTNVKNVLEKI